MQKIYNIILVLVWLSSPCLLFAQNKNEAASEDKKSEYYVTPNGMILLPQVVVTPKGNFVVKQKKVPRRYRKGTRAYNRTIRNLKVVYPLAKKASKMLKEIDLKLAKIEGERAKKKFVKQEYKKLMKIYKEPMKNLRISQGRMLIVLIHRETGNTSYQHIKSYKGGFTAFFWQGVARLFGNNLKKGYDPYGEHRYLEHLIQKYERGEL